MSAVSAADGLRLVRADFIAEELTVRPAVRDSLVVAAAGTIAAAALENPLLQAPSRAAGIRLSRRIAVAGLDDLLAEPAWELALILSPLKQAVTAHCDRLAPRACRTGVVDTLVRAGDAVVGYNTNSAACAAAACWLMGGALPARVLVVGSGASARSAAAAARRQFPQARLGIAARSAAGAARLIRDVAAGEHVGDPAGFRPDLIVHATTVGEQDDERALDIPLDRALRPGGRVLDLTNRLSLLQRQALAAGCVTMSGNLMQLITNTLRIALVAAG